MDTKQEFVRLMNNQTEIALATSVENNPNVRIVNFYFCIETKTLYFTTFGDNEKVKEFEANPKIAFSTIPHSGNEHVKARGIVTKSEKTIYDFAEEFVSKIPDYRENIEQAGDYLVLYEIKFDTATVTIDFENTDTISLKDLKI